MELVIVVLANSIKKRERCVAGREWLDTPWGAEFGRWIRPVSSHGEGELGISERLCQDGSEAQVLDIITLPVICSVSTQAQPENWQIDPGVPWRRLNRLARADLPGLLETPSALWSLGGPGGDRIGAAQVVGERKMRSLYLISPSDLKIISAHDYNPFVDYHQKKAWADFAYNGVCYRLKITDPNPPFTVQFPEKDGLCLEVVPPHGDDYYLCVSLTEAFKGQHYKLVASFIEA